VTPPRTRSTTPRLSEVARHVVAPTGIVSTGWPAVRDKAAELGIEFDPWQHGAGQLILAKRADGKYAATIGGTALSIPRQVGKTFLVGAIVFALCLLNPGLTVIWTAHRLRTAAETFDKMQGMARRKKIAPHVAKVVLGSGEEEVQFTNGSRILFGARERGFGRGFDEVDVLIFDEAQILTENAIDDMIPAMNQSRQPSGGLQLYMGTPPKPTDPGEVFTRMRTEALSGEDEDTGYIEFSADPDFVPSESPAPMRPEDWEQIARANPSFPKRTPREAILRMRKKLTAESNLREGYGIWDDPNRRKTNVFGRGVWEQGEREARPDDLKLGALGVAATLDQSHSAIVAGAADGDDRWVKPLRHGPGTGWVVEACVELQSAYGVDVVIDGRGPAAVLIPTLERAGVRLRTMTTGNVLDACAGIETLVRDGHLLYEPAPELNAAVDGAVKRDVGDRWAWGRRKSTSDISPLEAATSAVWAAGEPLVSVYEDEDYEVMVL
jgi:hypothetical protein